MGNRLWNLEVGVIGNILGSSFAHNYLSSIRASERYRLAYGEYGVEPLTERLILDHRVTRHSIRISILPRGRTGWDIHRHLLT